jgi:O-antigen ligase
VVASSADRLERISHGRTTTWSAGVEAAQARPVAGVGADAFYAGSRRHQGPRAVRFAHNLPLELLVELGVLGLVLVVGLYVAAGRVMWSARHAPEAWLLGPAVGAFLASNLLDWTWHMAACGAVFAAALGALIGVLVSARSAALDGARADR